ncbi:MAG: neutral zinc metallopeptidase [Cumulibacter sp.]
MNTRRPGRLFGLLALLMAVFVAAGCTHTVYGFASPATGGVKSDAPPSDMEIVNGDGSDIDQLVANSLDDIMAYWDDTFESAFGTSLEPLSGGVHAYDVNGTMAIPCFSDQDRQQAANNAFYCPSDDAIGYDRAFLQNLADQYGDFIVPLVMAHEFGHAIQNRVGQPSNQGIAIEGQADCYAGVFTEQTVHGTPHFHATSSDLDTVLGGYLLLRDEPGASASDPNAHGSAFDRVGAFQEGFNEGPQHCLNSFGPDREYAAIPYTSQQDYANSGNMAYDQMLTDIPVEMNTFADAVADNWSDVPTETFQGAPPSCGGQSVEQVFYCTDDKTVQAGEELVKQAYDKFGDFAAMTAIALGYGEAIQDVSGVEDDSPEGFAARLCLVGAYAGAAFETTVAQVQSPFGTLQLSAGDLDEAVMLMIAIGQDDAIINTYGMDSFDRIDTFRQAVLDARNDPEGTAAACLAA